MSDTGVAPNKVYQRTDGVRTGSAVNQQAQAAGAKNTAAYADARENDIATALNNRIMRDGGNQAAANLPMGGYKHTGVADATANNEYASKGQMDIAIAAITAAVAAGYQPLDDELTEIASSATAFGISLLAAADAAAARAIATPFPSGTAMLFVQTSAPTGWTKSTTHNNKALRIVSGTASSGGSTPFTTVFGARTIAANNLPNMTLSVTDPGHLHSTGSVNLNSAVELNGSFGASMWRGVASGSSTVGAATTGISVAIDNTSRGGVSQQTIDFAVQYVDCVICIKD